MQLNGDCRLSLDYITTTELHLSALHATSKLPINIDCSKSAGSNDRRCIDRTPGKRNEKKRNERERSMGIDIDRCVSQVNDGLLCCVCRDVLEQPLQAPCEHAFCTSCIHGWLVHEHTCPEDRRTLHASDLRPISRYMRRDLEELRVKCVNYREGCDFVGSLERIASHQVGCEYKLIKCTNSTCKTVLHSSKLAAHLLTCNTSLSSTPPSQSLSQAQSQSQSQRVAVADPTTKKSGELELIDQLKQKIEECESRYEKALEEQKRDIDVRLDAQRRHFVLKENGLQQQINTLREDNVRLREEVQRMNESMRSQKHEMENFQREKNEILDALRAVQTEIRRQRIVCGHSLNLNLNNSSQSHSHSQVQNQVQTNAQLTMNVDTGFAFTKKKLQCH